MKANPILEEVWRIKDQLAAEAGYDMKRFFDQLQTWTDARAQQGGVVVNSAEQPPFTASRQEQVLENPPSKS